MPAQRGNLVGMQQVGALASAWCLPQFQPPSTSSGLISKPESIADISPKTPLAPCCAVPFAFSSFPAAPLWQHHSKPSQGPDLFAVEVVLA